MAHRLASLSIALLAILLSAGTTTASAATFAYDLPTNARVDAHVFEAAGVGSVQLSSSREWSASPSVGPRGTSTTPGALVVATNTLGAVSDDALAYATRVEKLDHIFVPKHNLDALVTQLGSREAVVEQMLRGISGQTPAAGIFELTTTIEGQVVVVRGAVVDGVVKIGTAFTP